MSTNPFSEQGTAEIARFARRLMHAYAMPAEEADAAVLERCTLRDAAWAVNALAVALDTQHGAMRMFDAVAALGHPRLSPTAEAARHHYEMGSTIEEGLGKGQMPLDARVAFVIGRGEHMGRLDVALRGLGALLAWEGSIERRCEQAPIPQTEAEKGRRLRFEGAWGTARIARSLGLMFELGAEPAAAFRACADALDEPWKPFLERVADGLAANPSFAVLDGPESPLPELFAVAVERAREDDDLAQALARLGEFYGGIASDLLDDVLHAAPAATQAASAPTAVATAPAALAMRTMAVTLDSGSFVVDALSAVADLGHPLLGRTAGAARKEIERGSTMSDGMRKAGMPFDARVLNIVYLGEVAGYLDVALRGLADLLAWEAALDHRYQALGTPFSELDKARLSGFQMVWACACLARSLELALSLDDNLVNALAACADFLGEPWTPFLKSVAEGLADDPSLAAFDGATSPFPPLFAKALERGRLAASLPATLKTLGDYYAELADACLSPAVGIAPAARPAPAAEEVEAAAVAPARAQAPQLDRAWGLDLGGAGLTAVRLRNEGDSVVFDGHFHCAYEGAEGGVVSPEAVAAVLAAFLAQHADAAAESAVVTQPPPTPSRERAAAIVRQLDTPCDAGGQPRPLGWADLEAYVPYSEDNVIWDDFSFDDDPGVRRTVVVVPRDRIEGQMEPLVDAGLRPAALSHSLLTALAWVRFVRPEWAQEGGAIIDIRGGRCELLVLGEAGQQFSRDIGNVGAALFTAGPGVGDDLDPAIEHVLKPLDMACRFLAGPGEKEPMPLRRALLLGDSPHLATLAQRLRDRFDCEVVVPAEAAALGLVLEADVPGEDPTIWLPRAAVAMGLALQGLGRIQGANLLPA